MIGNGMEGEYPVSPGGDMIDAAPVAETETERQFDPATWFALAPQQPNLVDILDEMAVAELGRLVREEYEIDRESMGEWLGRMETGLNLANAVRNDKTFPWVGASNVRYPLVMTAALQFNARAYPAIVPPGDIVKCAVHGADPGGMKRARGDRVSRFISFQLRHTMKEWEQDTDRMLMQLPIVGTMLRKTWFDPVKGRPVSRLCRAGSITVNNAVTCLAEAPRLSEDIALYPHEIMERQRAGLFLDGDWYADDTDKDTAKAQDLIEQHRLFDVDGDGYPEPYVVTYHKRAEKVVRIVANWSPDGVTMSPDGRVARIVPQTYYEAYHFIPPVEGGFWGIGLGFLLNDISEAINGVINRLNDAGTLSSLGGGFIGKEARLSGGPIRVSPGEWKQITAAGSDLRAAIVPVPAADPSPVLFQMLGLLIEAAREVANVKDIQGEAGKSNQPATTTIALIEEGMRVFTAIYKRVHLGLKGEFARLAGINARHLDPMQYQTFLDEPADPAADFDLSDFDLEPVADPRAVTSPQKLAQAQLLGEMAAAGMVDPGVATQRQLEAAGIPNTEELAPKPDPMMAVAAEAQVRGAMLANVKMALELAEIEARIAKLQADTVKAMADAEAADPMNPVNVALAQAKMLKDMVDADRRRLEGMAGASGNGEGAARASGNSGGAPSADIAGLLANGGSQPAPVGQGASALVGM